MNKQEAAKIVAVIVTACPAQSSKLDRERIAGMIDTFAMLLDDVTYEQANAALRVLLQTRTWMPSVADIRSTVLELKRGPVRAGSDAWGSVLAAVRRYGSYRTPGTDFVFDDPTVARCVAALGWQNICLSENQIADRARFVDLYDKLAGEHRKESVAPMLGAARSSREAASVGEALADLLKLSGGS